MPRNGSGVYSLPGGYLATTGQAATAAQHNTPLEDIATALTDSLPRAGTAAMTGAISMGNNKITGLATPTATTDAATKAYVDTAAGAATVADADYGDITVSSTGTVFTINASSVEKSMIENLADFKVLGNVSGGAAAPAEVAVLDEDTMSSDSATSLVTQQSVKAYADAIDAKHAWELITTTETVGSSQWLEFTSLDDYEELRLQIVGNPAGDGDFQMQFGSSSTWISANYAWAMTGTRWRTGVADSHSVESTAQSSIELNNNPIDASDIVDFVADVIIQRFTSSAPTQGSFNSTYQSTTDARYETSNGGFIHDGATAMTRLRIGWESSTWSSGRVTLYGRK